MLHCLFDLRYHDCVCRRRPSRTETKREERKEIKYFLKKKYGTLDFSTTGSVANKAMLRDSIFPDWRDGVPHEPVDSPDEMQRKDPLATQIWKLYSRTKSQLPNQERMENLTWRMMAMSLRRQEKERAEQAR